MSARCKAGNSVGGVAERGRRDARATFSEKSGSHGFAAVSTAVAVIAAMGAAGFVQFRYEAGFH